MSTLISILYIVFNLIICVEIFIFMYYIHTYIYKLLILRYILLLTVAEGNHESTETASSNVDSTTRGAGGYTACVATGQGRSYLSDIVSNFQLLICFKSNITLHFMKFNK